MGSCGGFGWSRTGTELNEGSKERKGLNLVAVAAEVPSFALSDRRLLSLPWPIGWALAPSRIRSPWGAGRKRQRVLPCGGKPASLPRGTRG